MKLAADFNCDFCEEGLDICSPQEVEEAMRIQKFLDEKTPNFFSFSILCDECWEELRERVERTRITNKLKSEKLDVVHTKNLGC